MKTKAQIEFNKNYPTFQSFHTGKWGWRRVNGCANLKAAVFKSDRAAKLDRANAYKTEVFHG